jgi:hypothetical protein
LGSIRFSIEEIKTILICDIFYMVALDNVGPLLETKNGNKYALVAIDHYSKWCEARPINDHDAAIAVRFLEEEIICRFGVPKFIFINNRGERMAEFNLMCKKMGLLINSQLHNGLNAMGWWRE